MVKMSESTTGGLGARGRAIRHGDLHRSLARLVRVDEALGRVRAKAQVADRAIPDAHVGPVIVRGHVDGADVALYAAAIGPVGMGQQHLALADHLDRKSTRLNSSH